MFQPYINKLQVPIKFVVELVRKTLIYIGKLRFFLTSQALNPDFSHQTHEFSLRDYVYLD